MDRSERRLRGWAIFAALAFVGVPVIFALSSATDAIGAGREASGGPEWLGLILRSAMVIALATPVYFVLAASAVFGFRMGKIERWVILGHWIVVAAACQGEAWRLIAWTFTREAAPALGAPVAWALAAGFAQVVPYLVVWGAILHMLILEIEGSGEFSGDARGAGRRFWNLAWALWPAAMTGLLFVDVSPGVWRADRVFADVGPFGFWLLGVRPFARFDGEGTPLGQAVANDAAEVWVVAGAAVALLSLVWVARRILAARDGGVGILGDGIEGDTDERGRARTSTDRGGRAQSGDAPLTTAPLTPLLLRHGGTGSSGGGNPPIPERPPHPRVSPAAGWLAGLRSTPAEARANRDPKAFVVQFLGLNVALLALAVAPVYAIVSFLFHSTATMDSDPFDFLNVLTRTAKSIADAGVADALLMPAIAALAVGGIGWVLTLPSTSSTASTQSTESIAFRGVSPVWLLLAALAFWPLGWRVAAGLSPEPIAAEPIATLAGWLPNGLVLAPLLLLCFGPRRRLWPLPMAVAAVTGPCLFWNMPILESLAGPAWLSDTAMSPTRAFGSGSPGWAGTGTAAMAILLASTMIIGTLWMLAAAAWPRTRG